MKRSAVPSQRGGVPFTNKRKALDPLPVTSNGYDEDERIPFSLPQCSLREPSVSSQITGQNGVNEGFRRFSVVYGKVSTRKHKKWEGDGFLICKGRSAVLQTEDGKDVARAGSFSKKCLDELEDGSRVVVGGFEVEVQNEVFSAHEPAKADDRPVRREDGDSVGKAVTNRNSIDEQSTNLPGKSLSRSFVQPFIMQRDENEYPEFVVNESEVSEGLEKVSIRGLFARHLRPHQKQGITFLYEKLKDKGGGAILADEMGLGKSVQTIYLIWALMKKQECCGAEFGKCVLIVPSSLLGNWQCEFKKWLPQSRSLLYVISKSNEYEGYLRSARYSPVVLMSYEMALRLGDSLASTSFTLLVCDEAHRLKNLNGRLRQFIGSLCTDRRLLLTGTPLQNEPNEFFSLLDLACPGICGSQAEFSRSFASDSDQMQLHSLLSGIVLRRTSEVNCDYLPPKYEYILFCNASDVQRELYSRIIDLGETDHLTLIGVLKKLCNHPSILYQSSIARLKSPSDADGMIYRRLIQLLSENANLRNLSVCDSGKLSVFVEMMGAFREANEKVVVVSNFTKTLDMLEEVCNNLFFIVTRLDGSVEQQSRMKIVNEFNAPSEYSRVILLSAKAGGLGLNLIGANRLILFDSDWNPAVDLQAMARIWRDGQKKPCHIYRLVTTGTIDEKILQRQVMKSGLSAIVDMDSLSATTTQFSAEDLSDLFSIDWETASNTHDLMECDCGGCGLLPLEIDDLEGEISTDDTSGDQNVPEEVPIKDGVEKDNVIHVETSIEQNAEDGCIVNDEAAEDCLNGKHAVQNEAVLEKKCRSIDETIDQKKLLDSNKNTTEEEHSTLEIKSRGEHAVLEEVTSDDFVLKANPASPVATSKRRKTHSASASMATLLRWRHYSREHTEQFELLKSDAGLMGCPLKDVTFVMKLTCNY